MQIDKYLMVYLVDVTGHGLEGAMLNIFIRETINSFLLSVYSPGDELSPSEIIKFIALKYEQENFPEDYFICILLGVCNLETMDFTFGNAGIQIPPLIISENKDITSLTQGGLPISAVIENKSQRYQEEEIFLRKVIFCC